MKTALITGANRGIGLALTEVYLNQGWQVIAVCRSSSVELSATSAEVIEGIDVAKPEDVKMLCSKLGNRTIDLLINNAGILRGDHLGNINYEDVTQQLEINAVAPIRIAEALLDNLGKGGKIALITSRMGSISDNSSGGYYGYRMSKAALNAGATSLALDVKKHDIAVAILHPGYVQTAMVGFDGDITATEAATRLSQRIAELNMQNTGGFWHSNGEQLPW